MLLSVYSWAQQMSVSAGKAAILSKEASICSGVPSNKRPQPMENKVSPQKRKGCAPSGPVLKKRYGRRYDPVRQAPEIVIARRDTLSHHHPQAYDRSVGCFHERARTRWRWGRLV